MVGLQSLEKLQGSTDVKVDEMLKGQKLEGGERTDKNFKREVGRKNRRKLDDRRGIERDLKGHEENKYDGELE